MQSTIHNQGNGRFHVAIIMDGNGRWALARGLPREAGHRAGMIAFQKIAEAAPSFGITTLSVFAFSAENWKRPRREVEGMMATLRRYLRHEVQHLADTGVRVRAIGRRDRLSGEIVELLARAEAATAEGTALDLRIAIDYSAREAILGAVSAAGNTPLTRDVISRQLASGCGGSDVDLIIRTSGEQRLSDFMLWEAAHAELYFTPVLWPDFDREALSLALAAYSKRERRFGGLEKNAVPQRLDAGGCDLPLQMAGRQVASAG